VALLDPTGFKKRVPDRETQEWWLAVRADGIAWRRGQGEALEFDATPWR
jgi:hypothetical protein